MTKRFSKVLAVLATALLALCLFAATALASPYDENYSVNDNGTVTFENNAYPTASKVTFSLSNGVTFNKAITDEISAGWIMPAFAVANAQATTTGGYDYYCWPEKASFFQFNLPNGYVITDATIAPDDAGEIQSIDSEGTVGISLSKPATLSIEVDALNWNHVDTDERTGISVTLGSIDAKKIGDASLYVNQVTASSDIKNAKDTIKSKDGFEANGLVAYDVWYQNADGYQPLGGLVGVGALQYEAWVTIPLPSGWNVENTRVYQYYEEPGSKGAVRLEYETIDGGKALKVFPNMCLGRFVLATTDNVAMADGWVKDSGSWYYYKNGAMLKNAWVQDGAWYYLGSDGIMLANSWVQSRGAWYYLGPNGAMLANAWAKSGGAWYYLGPDGKMLANAWAKSGGAWYYLGSDGKMLSNSWVKSGGAWYYLGSDGRMVANNWVKYNGKYYYLNGNGNPVTNTWIKYNGKYYHFNASGVCDRTA